MKDKETILVTGAGGYLGSVLVPMLLEKSYLVKAAGRSFKNATLALKEKYSGLEIIQKDISEEDVLKSLVAGADAVVHLAGLVGEKQCLENPEAAKKANIDLAIEVNEARKNLPFIFLSSTSVYGSREQVVCDEKAKPEPELAYAKSKYQGELAVSSFDNVIVLRAATFFGWAPAINFKVLINDFVSQAVKNKKLEIYDDSLNRTFIHIQDLARAVIFFIENFSEFKNQIFNVGSNSLNSTKRKIAETIKEFTDFELVIKESSEGTDKRNFIVNYDKIEKTGFKTQISLSQGIKDLISKIS